MRIITGSVLWMPANVLTTIGKNAITKASSSTRDVIPSPNQTMNSGASATLGTTWKAITSRIDPGSEEAGKGEHYA